MRCGRAAHAAVVPEAALGVGLVALVALLGGCGPEAEVRTLAKVDGWDTSRTARLPPPGLLEIAYEGATAEELWAQNVPPALRELAGDPREPGVYGDLGGVDFQTEVVALWSSVESGSCPTWLTAVRFADDAFDPDEHLPSGDCTSDAVPYRTVVVLPRDAVPTADELPVRAGGSTVPGGVVAYPHATVDLDD